MHTKKFNFHDECKIFSNTNEGILHGLYREGKWYNFLKKAIEFKKNIIISGGTSSGKTTFLNACIREIDAKERLLILEDTREINAPHLNKVELLAIKNQNENAKIYMQDLVQCSLRLRPDRIIIGEIRGKEILDFIGAAATGHGGSMTTIHADNPKIAFMRMVQMYKLNNVPAMQDKEILNELQETVDIIVQLNKVNHVRQISSIYLKNYMQRIPENRKL